jgi:hypothetical protein
MLQHQQWPHREDCSSINNGHIKVATEKNAAAKMALLTANSHACRRVYAPDSQTLYLESTT